MGASPSQISTNGQEQVFTASSPVRFAPDLLESLERSPESDVTRSSDHELHIQRRVAAELSRLEAEASGSLEKIKQDISAAQESKGASAGNTSDRADQTLLDTISKGSGASETAAQQLSRAGVQREIENLKRKLENRRLRQEVTEDPAINKAKEGVVQCLKGNARQPLDCWQEVEAFKKEVGRLEEAFIGRIID